jgi:hypothetical protein
VKEAGQTKRSAFTHILSSKLGHVALEIAESGGVKNNYKINGQAYRIKRKKKEEMFTAYSRYNSIRG